MGIDQQRPRESSPPFLNGGEMGQGPAVHSQDPCAPRVRAGTHSQPHRSHRRSRDAHRRLALQRCSSGGQGRPGAGLGRAVLACMPLHAPGGSQGSSGTAALQGWAGRAGHSPHCSLHSRWCLPKQHGLPQPPWVTAQPPQMPTCLGQPQTHLRSRTGCKSSWLPPPAPSGTTSSQPAPAGCARSCWSLGTHGVSTAHLLPERVSGTGREAPPAHPSPQEGQPAPHGDWWRPLCQGAAGGAGRSTANSPLVEAVLQSKKPSPMVKRDRLCSPSRTTRKWDPSSSMLLMVPLSTGHRCRNIRCGGTAGCWMPLRVALSRVLGAECLDHHEPPAVPSAHPTLTTVCPVQPGASIPKGEASGCPGSPPDGSAAGAVHGCALHQGAVPAGCCDKAHGGGARAQRQPGSALQPLAEQHQRPPPPGPCHLDAGWLPPNPVQVPTQPVQGQGCHCALHSHCRLPGQPAPVLQAQQADGVAPHFCKVEALVFHCVVDGCQAAHLGQGQGPVWGKTLGSSCCGQVLQVDLEEGGSTRMKTLLPRQG